MEQQWSVMLQTEFEKIDFQVIQPRLGLFHYFGLVATFAVEWSIFHIFQSLCKPYHAFQSDGNGITGCQLNQFCCGYSLRTGTKVIGSLSMLGGVAVLIHSLTVISSLNNVRDGNDFLLGNMLGNENHSKIPLTSFVTSAVAIVCSIPVLVMAYKNLSPRLLVPWLVVNIVPSLAVIGFFIYLAVFELITEGLDDIIGIIVIFAGVLSGAIWFYFWLVIYSFYQNQKVNDRQQPLLDDQS